MISLSGFFQWLGIGNHAQDRPYDDKFTEYIVAQQIAERDRVRRGNCWTRDGDKLVLDGFPMITIRRSTPEEIAKAYGVGVFCVECGNLPPQFPSTLELAQSLGIERAQEIDELPLTGGQPSPDHRSER